MDIIKIKIIFNCNAHYIKHSRAFCRIVKWRNKNESNCWAGKSWWQVYDKTKHNVGFEVIDLLADSYNINVNKLKTQRFCWRRKYKR